mgnify:FL=1
MRISKVQINGFGNIVNKSFEFDNGINLVRGNNEDGKSTLVYFIKSMLYGINRNKSGESFSELERFNPWQSTDFSGKMEYSIDGKKFSIYRDFNRNNSKVFDDSGTDITAQFNKDKSRGVEVGFTHLGIDEETFFNSAFVSQGKIEVDSNERRDLIQKITNVIQSGDEAVSYDKAQDRLHKLLLEEVGTERTRNRPINVITRGIEAYEKTRDSLVFNREKKESVSERKKIIQKKLKEIDEEYNDASKVFEIKDKYERMTQEREKEHEISLKILEKEREEKIKKRNQRKDNMKSISITILIVAIVILLNYELYIWTIIPVVLIIISLFAISKFFSKDIEIDMPQDLDVIKANLKRKEEKELELLVKSGIKESLTKRKITDLGILISGLEKNKNDLILEQHKLDIESDSLNEHLEKLNDVEEQLCDLYEKEEEVRQLEYSINIAIDVLQEAYEELKADVVPDIENSIKRNITTTTKGKYSNVIYNDRQGLLVENTNGEIVSIEKLSTGTIEQMYLGFRFAMLEKMGGIPIFLDEAFAYYDDERLENILNVIYQKSKHDQVFVFTCSDREKLIMDKLNIKYNDVILSKCKNQEWQKYSSENL